MTIPKKNNSTNSQRARILRWLRKAPLTTLQARQELFIMSIAARIFELKERGHNIQTFMVDAAFGSKRKVARYVLIPEATE